MKYQLLELNERNMVEEGSSERKMTNFLETISEPGDVQHLNLDQLESLAEECRQRIIEVTSKRGGHLASSLGAVEITIALFKLFDLKKDRLVWDVGHQAYTHKLLTGRSQQFETLAQSKGVKKFLSRDESPYDHFGAGHASTSISSALGMAIARDLQKHTNRVVAVIGDGAMTGGLAFEALNHNGFLDKNLLLIYNDNGMSIDPNVGALSKLLTRIASSRLYNIFREESLEIAERAPFSETLGLKRTLQMMHDSMKAFFKPPGMLFEQLGWRYMGPVNGHSLKDLIELIGQVRDLEGPIVIHALTQKGKGYSFAEEDAFKYHGVSPFVPEDGSFLKKSKSSDNSVSYSKVFSEKLGELMEKDSKVVGVSAAMLSGTGLIGLQKKYPERIFDVGIAEGHAVTCSAGMATEGLKPYVAIYSTFLQRALDHIIHDVAIQKLPVRFMLDRAGLVGADGPTHQGVYDLTYLRMIPGMTIMVPRDGAELRMMIDFSYHYESGPIAVRYPRGNTVLTEENEIPPIEMGRAHLLQDGADIVLLAVGVMVEKAIQTANILEQEGFSVAVVNARFVKPLDQELILNLASNTNLVVTMEENTILGGFGTAVTELLNQSGMTIPTLTFGIPDRYISQGTPEEQSFDAGLSSEQMSHGIRERYQQLPIRKKSLKLTRKKAS